MKFRNPFKKNKPEDLGPFEKVNNDEVEKLKAKAKTNSNDNQPVKPTEDLSQLDNLEIVDKQRKVKNQIFFPFHVIIYSKKGAWGYDRDFGVEVFRDKDTGNKYLVRLVSENGVKKIVFFEPFPEDELKPREIMLKAPKYKDRIDEIEKALENIQEEENKTRKKLSINKKDLILERLKLKREVASVNNFHSEGQYIVEEKGNIDTIQYKEQDGLLFPQKRYFVNNAVVVPSENKRASRARQSEINKKVFSQENKVHWGLIFAYLAALILFGLNVWWSMNLQDDARELPNAKINDLRIAIEENNYQSAEEAKRYCNDMYQSFIEDIKRLRNPDLYKSDPKEVQG